MKAARRIRRAQRWAALLTLAFSTVSTEAFAQGELTPPRVTTNVEPQYPAEKKGSGEAAVVVVDLAIDATGKVTDAKIRTSGGDAFDAAALEAAKILVFEPAKRGETPIPSKIPYRFEFAAEKAPEPPPAEIATDGLFGGRVLTSGEEAIPGATLRIRAEGVPERTVTCDSQGAFQLRLPPGNYDVTLAAEGFDPTTSRETVVAGEAANVVYRLRAKVDPTATTQDIDVKGDRPPREVTRRVLERRELTRIPGTNGDALRAIENMPGVARPPGLAGLLIVRGSAPADTGIFVDGTNVPIAFHFGGLTSVVPSEMLSRIDFFPGNFGPEYSRAMGGVVDIGIRSPAKDKFHGLAQIDLLDARVLAEAPLGKSTRFLVAGRRSHVDAWLGPVMESGGAVGVSVAPVYYDYQAVLEQDLGKSTTARLLFHGSDDRLALTLNAAGGDPAASGSLKNHTQFFRIQARTETKLGEGTRWLNMLSYGRDWQELSLSTILDLDIKTMPLQFRSDLRHRITNGLTAIAGVDVLWTQADVSVYAAPIPEDEQANGPFFARPRRLQQLESTLFQPGGYAMLEIAPHRRLKLLPSVRADYSSDIKDWRAAPRAAVRLDVNPEGSRRTTVKGGAGIFNQAPQPYESFRPFGTPNLRHNQAQHYSIGVEQEFTDQLELSVEGFYKKLDYLVDQRADATGSESGVTYTNSGSGRVFGGEFLLRYKPDKHLFGWIAYTLSRSERRADDSEAYRVFDYDQTHILTALASYKLGRGWEVGARFRYVTGNPYTPAVTGIYDADAGAYSPVNGTPFSGRSAAFHRLDIRIDKTWDFKSWKLGAYLDIQNTYMRQNPEGLTYNYNYSRSEVISGLPFLPVLGLRGEM